MLVEDLQALADELQVVLLILFKHGGCVLSPRHLMSDCNVLVCKGRLFGSFMYSALLLKYQYIHLPVLDTCKFNKTVGEICASKPVEEVQTGLSIHCRCGANVGRPMLSQACTTGRCPCHSSGCLCNISCRCVVCGNEKPQNMARHTCKQKVSYSSKPLKGVDYAVLKDMCLKQGSWTNTENVAHVLCIKYQIEYSQLLSSCRGKCGFLVEFREKEKSQLSAKSRHSLKN